MDLSTMLTILSIIAFTGTGMTIMLKWNSKRISLIAIEEIKKSQEVCGTHRGVTMGKLAGRITELEQNDISKQLTIVRIESTLENLSQAHETTQAMIMDMGKQFHEITGQLIETIKTFNK